MNSTTKPALNVAILVRKFPNIVQTYVLNHILSLKSDTIKTIIIAERDSKQNEINPRVIENALLDETLYITSGLFNFIKQLSSQKLSLHRYIKSGFTIAFSTLWFKRGPIYTLKSIIRAGALAKHDIDIVHSHSMFNTYDYLFLKDVFSIPITTTFHGLLPKNVKNLNDEKIKKVLDTGDKFFVNTEFAKKQLTGLGCKQEKIRIIPQGTDTTDFPFTARRILPTAPIIILSVGRLSIEKGFHVAIKAIATLVKHHPNIKYNIIGGGPEEQNLTDLIDKYNIHNNVTIFGSVSTDELLSQYSKCHIFILPSIDFSDGSHTETQGVVLQEAQSSGVPVIASKTGGIPEVIIDGVTGLLFEEENDKQLVQKIESLICNAELYAQLSERARKDVEENYSIDVITRKLLDEYSATLAGKT